LRPRFWIVLLALLLLIAAPGETVSTEVVDAQVVSIGDEADVSVQELGAPEHALDPRCVAFDRAEILAPAPVLAGIFRPPRPAAG
jgi:hypothetical protein